MPLYAVTPDIGFRWSAENRKILLFWVAVLIARILNNSEHFFQAHDGHGFDLARLTESGTEQGSSQVLLIRSHLPKRQTFALLRNKACRANVPYISDGSEMS
jgi:hypothetical protein